MSDNRDRKGIKGDWRAVSEIVSRGNDAEVKRGRDGDILVLEVRKKIIKRIKGL